MKLNIVADENMPQIEKLFSNIANITRLSGRQIKQKDLINTDALLCRSVTSVNQALLANTKVQFVGTATIGTDHLDIDYLTAKKINWVNAAGCNSEAVAQYVLSAISSWLLKTGKQFKHICVGIAGAGNVGSALEVYLKRLGAKVLLCDPPLEQAQDPRQFHRLSALQNCDVISLHVPLVKTGKNATYHMVNSPWLAKLNSNQLVINAARGAVIDNKALVNYLSGSNCASFVLDVFEDEPNINSALVKQCFLATPHIAGHTLEGKLRGSYKVYQAFCEHFDLKTQWPESCLYPKLQEYQWCEEDVSKNLLSIYNINKDSQALKLIKPEQMQVNFDRMRKNYLKNTYHYTRRDFSGWFEPNKQQTLEQYLKS